MFFQGLSAATALESADGAACVATGPEHALGWVYPALLTAAVGFALPAACAFGNPALRKCGKAAAILSLFLLASTLLMVKDYTGWEKSDFNERFAIARNGASLAFALIPFALVAMRPGRCERAGMVVVGLCGVGLLAALLGVEGSLWTTDAVAERPSFHPERIPGAAHLTGHGELRVGWWLLLAGLLLSSAPLAADAWSGAFRRPPRSALTPYLLGAGLTTLAMAILFWHQEDRSHRDTAYGYIRFLPLAAAALAWVDGRLPTARFSLRLLSGFALTIALWILAGGGFSEHGQSLCSGLTLLHEFYLLLMPVLLLVDGAVHLLLRREAPSFARKPRPPFK